MISRKYCGAQKTQIKIYDKIEALPKAWDSILPAGHDLCTHSLLLYEKIQLPDIRNFYVVFGTENQPKAIAYFQLLQVLPKHLNTAALGAYQSTLAPICLQVFRPTLLVAGHLFRHDVQNFFSSDLSPLEAFRAYEQMIQAVGNQTKATAYLIKDVAQHLVQYFTNFAPNYALLRNDIAMQMPIPAHWQRFDDYEKSLKHKYAQKCRKVRSTRQSLSFDELNTDEVIRHKHRIFELYRQVSSKQIISLGLLNEDFIPELKRNYPNHLKVWAIREGQDILAFASAWIHEECFDMFYIVFDYSHNNRLNLYFNILYFSIEQAIEHKKSMLNLGRTALEAKARLGCTPRYLPTFLFVRNVCIRALVNSKINQQHENEGAWEERHPFKQ